MSAQFLAHYDGETATINKARQDLVDWLHDHDLSPLAQDAELVLSELASNATEAAPGRPYVVTATLLDRTPARASLEVRNDGETTLPPVSEWGPTDVLATRGRGLTIVRALAHRIDIHIGNGQTAIEVELSEELNTG